ncbi:MAG: NADH-quinone oxidoreductase subunit D, partial [Actinomycetota bacterium]
LSRLRVRLAEVGQSLDLIGKAGSVSVPRVALGGRRSGTGTATVETPRGAARLSLILDEGTAVAFDLDTPSTLHLGLIKPVSEQRELADALVGIASLDLSPWEVTR